MSSLARFGRRQAKRLHSLTSRQAAVLLLIAAACAGVAAASALGRPGIASTLLAVLLAATLAGLLHLSRRLGGLHRSQQASLQDLRVVVDQLQRRVVAAVEKERLAAGDRHQELTDAIGRADRLTPSGAETLLRAQIGEIEALTQLFTAVTPRAAMPPAGTPTDLLGLLDLVRGRRPGLTVALGAGDTGVWLAYALESAGRLVVVEHDAERAARTRTQLLAHGLTAVEVLHAPLTELSLDGRTVDWYDVDALDGLREIDLIVVDGPAGPESLPPALHVLGRRLSAGGAVVVEDGPRTAPRQGGFTPERPVAGRWAALTYTPAMSPVAS
jgi:predicted O-methyltransferase YrrM